MAGDIDTSTPGPAKAVQKERGTFVKGLYVGVATATCGGLVSALVATLKNNPRSRLYVFGTTLNCFILGTGFYVTREVLSNRVLKIPQDQSITARERIILTGASAAAVGGAWGAVIGGRRNLLPGLITFGLAGLGGQAILIAIETSRKRSELNREREGSTEAQPKGGMVSRWLNSESNIIRKLSKEEYVAKMREKQLAIDVEIALVDEEIERLSKKLEEGSATKEDRGDST
ncbi:hypothetical protein TWF730_003398 [Orbilia blumenaviensis]|uniref:Uncharacterized protein n=1 Tax=Orbilia blumenaviensis TaxID=1796055 RepID=A0AAV9U7K4_9PEZI